MPANWKKVLIWLQILSNYEPLDGRMDGQMNGRMEESNTKYPA